MNYWKYEILNVAAEQSDIIIATLSELGLEGFEENDAQLIAYGKTGEIDSSAVEDFLHDQNLSFVKSVIEEQNWNAVWESNFDPVEVDDFVYIRADFHPSKPGFEQEIRITPKMSFGTGHHATTFSVMQMMRKIDCKNKSVCDYGTGTAVLAILAEKMGASSVLGIDNDDWSIENAEENLQRNHCTKIKIVKDDTIKTDQAFDIVLANINRNVLLDQMKIIASAVKKDGDVLLSGFYEEDVDVLLAAASREQLYLTDRAMRNKWVCLHLKKQ